MNRVNLSIIIPVYNEEKTVGETISSLISKASSLEITHEIIAVNDASTDKSEWILEKFVPSIKKINHPFNKGYGASLKTGIKQSRYDWIMIMDGDGTYPVEFLPSLLKEIGQYDMVIGARDK